MTCIGEDALDDIAVGAAILGCGGGGDPHVGKLLARSAIRAHGPVEVVDVDAVDDEALIVPLAMMGAPTVANEKLASLRGMRGAVEALGEHCGRPVTHTIAVEAGGINGVMPLPLAAELGIPVIDGDMMGRAFPEIQMAIPTLYGISAAPLVMADEKGNTVLFDTVDNHWTERFARVVAIEMGATSLMALYALTGAQAKQAIVRETLTLSRELGVAVRSARARHGDPIAAVCRELRGFRLFTGKVTDVERRTVGGFSRLRARIEGLGPDAGTTLQLGSQNEHMVAERDGAVLASAPDLIMVLDAESAEPVTTEALSYGFRVTVLAAPCDPRYRTEAGLALVGPRCFGFDVDHVPVEVLATGARAR